MLCDEYELFLTNQKDYNIIKGGFFCINRKSIRLIKCEGWLYDKKKQANICKC